MTEQPESLRLANWLDALDVRTPDRIQNCVSAATELRRLHEVNRELLEALKVLHAEEWRDDDDPMLYRARIKARAAIAKAGETK